MEQESTASSVTVQALLNTLGETGIDPTELCVVSGIELTALADPRARIPRSRVIMLWREAAARLRDPHLGLHLAERARPRAANVVTYLSMSSRTLREGLERFIHYQRILGGGSRVRVRDEGAQTFIEIDFGSEALPATPNEIDYWTVMLLKYGRWIADMELALVEVRFSYPQPDSTVEYARIFGCRPQFDAAENGLLIRSAELDRPSVHANPEIAAAHQQFAYQYVKELDDFETTRQLRELLMWRLEKGTLALEEAASLLHMGARTLQRRLREESTTYREAVDTLRRDVALNQLRTTDASIEEITYLTGFSEVSPFYRAVRRWTGKTPVEYRAADASRPGRVG